MLTYHFEIYTYDIVVVTSIENEYLITIDGNYAGMIYVEFLDEPPFMVWKTRDLIADVLVKAIGAAIEDEDE